jgi:hypothetical protein
MKKLISISASLLLAGASLVAIAAPAQATNFIGKYYVASYNFSGTDTIHEVDPRTGVVSAPVATITMTNASKTVEALEVDGATGLAYFSTSDGEFWKVNLSNGVSTKLVSSPAAAFSELAMNPVTGDLYGMDGGYNVWSINKDTGASVSIGTRPISTQQNLVQGNGFAVNALGEFYFLGKGGSPKLEIANHSLRVGLTVGAITGVANALSFAIYASDLTQDGDLVMYSPTGVDSPRIQTVSAAAIANFDKVGFTIPGVSTTQSTFASSIPLTLQFGSYNIDPYSFAIANGVAPANKTVSYDANTGTGTEAATTGSGALTVSTGTNYTRSGFTLSGWNTLADGTGTPVALGASYTPSQNETLYAQWAAIPVTAPLVVQAPVYNGPEFNAIAGRLVDSMQGAKVVLTGRRLDTVTKISLAGKVLVPTKSAESAIELTVPAGTPGSATLEILFGSGRMTWENAFEYVDPAVVKAAALKRIPAPAKKPAKVTKPKPKAKK